MGSDGAGGRDAVERSAELYVQKRHYFKKKKGSGITARRQNPFPFLFPEISERKYLDQTICVIRSVATAVHVMIRALMTAPV